MTLDLMIRLLGILALVVLTVIAVRHLRAASARVDAEVADILARADEDGGWR